MPKQNKTLVSLIYTRFTIQDSWHSGLNLGDWIELSSSSTIVNKQYAKIVYICVCYFRLMIKIGLILGSGLKLDPTALSTKKKKNPDILSLCSRINVFLKPSEIKGCNKLCFLLIIKMVRRYFKAGVVLIFDTHLFKSFKACQKEYYIQCHGAYIRSIKDHLGM